MDRQLDGEGRLGSLNESASSIPPWRLLTGRGHQLANEHQDGFRVAILSHGEPWEGPHRTQSDRGPRLKNIAVRVRHERQRPAIAVAFQ